MKNPRFAIVAFGLTAASLSAALGSALLLTAGTPAATRADEAAAPDAFKTRIRPLLQKYCVECHNQDDRESGISLDAFAFADQADALKGGRTWLRVRDVLEGRSMPPSDMPQPSLEELDGMIGWVEKDFLAAQCGQNPDPAPVVIRRLNRQEYNNTVRDLLGVNLDLSAAFPADDIGFGFDNVGSALNISPVHVEKYLDAAELALDKAIVPPDVEGMPPIELIGLKTYPLPAKGSVEFEHTLKPGRYLADFSLVRVGISETVPPPRLLIGFGKDTRTVDAVRVQDETVVYRYWLSVAEGDKKVTVKLATGQSDTANVVKPTEVTANVSGDQRYRDDRGLHVDSMVVKGPLPFEPAGLPASHKTVLFKTPGFGDDARLATAREVVARFAERAYRRPVEEGEVDRILEVFRLADDRGESFERSVQVALTTVLSSPQFLFLVEPEESREDRPLTEFELASRLSYFLWSSTPDEELFREAKAGTLRLHLREQSARMLDDPKSDALVENFAGQWLQLRRLATATPDKDLFPGFDDTLRASMRRETERYFAYVLRENRGLGELLDSDYTFVNGPLAKHYGIDGVAGDDFRKVALADRRRGGVLTQASVLTLTSNPNRTSPVKRGQYILQQILGTPPPPPPPDVAKLDESAQAAEAAPLRERLELHRAKAECATCHRQMDPLGFALENYDAVGRWRTSDGPFKVDPSGELAGGRKFADAQELKKLLGTVASKKFTRSLVRNLLTYGLGRGLEASDYCTVEAIGDRLASDGGRIRGIIYGIVESRAFQSRGVSKGS